MARKQQTVTQRLRTNIKRQISRMEKRGYKIPSELKEQVSTAKYQTLKSLQKNRYSKLYKQSEAKIEGKTVTGTKFRTYERQKAGQKAAETRKRTVDFSDLAGTFDPETGEIFEPSTFYRQTGYQQGGDMSAYESTDIIIDNILNDFIEKLEQEVPE